MGDTVKAVSVASLGLSGEIADQLRTIAVKGGGPDLDTVEEFQQAALALGAMEAGMVRARQAIGMAASNELKVIVVEKGKIYEYQPATVEEGGGCGETIEHPIINRQNLATGQVTAIHQWVTGCAGEIRGKISKIVTDGKEVYVYFENKQWIGKVVVEPQSNRPVIGFIGECSFFNGCSWFSSPNVKITDLQIVENQPIAVVEDLESHEQKNVPLERVTAGEEFGSCHMHF